jgi:molecular chaperone DnaK
MLINTCCGYESEISYDLCPECHEHCDWEDLDEDEIEDEIFTELDPELAKLVEQGQKLIDTLEDEQADELQDLLDRLEEAISEEETALIAQLQEELSDFLYYSTTKDS